MNKSTHQNQTRTLHQWRLATFVFLCLLTSFFGFFPVLIIAGTWDGGGADNFLGTAGNWVGDVAPNNDGTANFIFAGTVQRTNAHGADWSINSLTYSNNAGSFLTTNSSGGPFYLTIGSGGIINNSTNTQAINSPIGFSVAQTWQMNAGMLILSNVAFGNTLPLTVTGATNGTLVIRGAGNWGQNGGLNTYSTIVSNSNFVVTNGGSITHWNDNVLLNSRGSLFLSNGGVVAVNRTDIGSSIGSNKVVVTGSGSVFSNQNGVWVGSHLLGSPGSSSNLLLLDNGAVGKSTGLYIGARGFYSNAVILRGGSTWNAGGSTVAVGWIDLLDTANGRNVLVVDNSRLTNVVELRVGYEINTVSNSMYVSNGALVQASGVRVGYRSDYNLLQVEGSTTLFNFQNNFLNIGHKFNSDGSVSLSNRVVVNAATLSNINTLTVGFGNDVGTELLATNGARIYSTNDLLLGKESSQYARLTLLNTGTFLSNTGNFYVGSGLSTSHALSNTVTVANGAAFTNSGFTKLGYFFGGYNTLYVTNGGKYKTVGITVGEQPSESNLLYVAGSGSVFDNSGGVLAVGYGLLNNYFPNSNRVVIADSAVFTNTSVEVGRDAASRNSLVLSNGAIMHATSLTIGYGQSRSNLVLVDGASTVWNNGGGNVQVGNSGSLVGGTRSNILSVLNGASMTNVNALNVGRDTFDSDNTNGVLRLQSGAYVSARSLHVRPTNYVEHGGGTLVIGTNGTIYNTTLYTVGDGTQTAALGMMGGTHRFTNGLTVAANGTLFGTNGTVDVASGAITNNGVISAGTTQDNTVSTYGSMTFSDSLWMGSGSTSLFQFSSASLFDSNRVFGTLTAGGSLNLQFDYEPLDTTGFVIFQTDATPGGTWGTINWLGSASFGTVTNIGNNVVVTNVGFFSIWDGGGTDNNWGTADNWVGNRSPTNVGTARVVFATTPNLRTNSVVNTAWYIRNLTFSNSVTTNYYLTGSAITMNGFLGTGIVQNSTSFQTISNNLILSNGAQTWFANSGELRLAGNVNITTNNLTFA
ncbi:MAG: hypothetical protein SFY92_01500, partial [Verrucomicrobiae bacterium]|nr:hypothetical protein [Verrucomicrobiae bacterium]